MVGDTRDIFLCHASEDKEEVLRPIVEACGQAGISCWFDEAEIKWGDSITQKVNEGLTKARYVVVVFSTSFVEKNWPQRELYATLNQEAATGEVKVLPLLVGSAAERKKILVRFPLLNDKRYLPWDGDLRAIVAALLARLRPNESIESVRSRRRPPPSPGLRIPLPKIKKQFTQRDKDIFLRDSFGVVKSYFERALQDLGDQYQEAQTDFAAVHSFKFVATIYVRGEVGNR